MSLKIKICGITNKEDALWSANLGADIIGFIFAESKRKVSIDNASLILKELPPYVRTVGVFADPELKFVEKVFKTCKFNYIQLHGNESSDFIAEVKNMNIGIIKAIRVKDQTDLANSIAIYNNVDFLLLDTYTEGQLGGTGLSFDWALLSGLNIEKPFFLSGGLNPLNVLDAVKKVKPAGVDVSSGVEVSIRKKDYDLMKEFIANARKSEKFL